MPSKATRATRKDVMVRIWQQGPDKIWRPTAAEEKSPAEALKYMLDLQDSMPGTSFAAVERGHTIRQDGLDWSIQPISKKTT